MSWYQHENERSVASAGSVAGSNDLIDRLSHLSVDVDRWGGKTIGEAISEIARLRLTDAEREAVQVARDAYADDDGNAECEKIAAVLSRLLERLK